MSYLLLLLSLRDALSAQSAHTYRECHILVHAALQQAQYNLLGLLPRYNIYRWVAVIAYAYALDKFRAIDKGFYGEHNHQIGLLLRAGCYGLLGRGATYNICRAVAHNLSHERCGGAATRINHYL